MRHAILSPLLILALSLAGLATPLRALEVEAHRVFTAQPEAQVLRILSATDIDVFAPVIEDFQQNAPGVSVDYTVASSTEIMRAISEAQEPFDLVLSSAMDLQTKLANDGLTQPHASPATAALPDWANWRDHVLAFTQEPAVMVFSPAAFDGLEIPRNRQDLINLLRAHPDRYRGRVGTYDVRESGLGYLFATQDARTSEIFWRLTEVMGGMQAQLYCCSGQMIEEVASGRIAMAYNVLGSYARARQRQGAPIVIVEPEDFTTVMLRSAVIPRNAEQPELAGDFIDRMLRASSGAQGSDFPFPPIAGAAADSGSALRPIRIGPGLLVFLDRLKRQYFLDQWTDAILQD